MLQVQTRKPPRTLNHHANIRTDKPTPNSMMTRVLSVCFQPLFTTVDPKELSAEEVLELYRVRWQIELRFKHLKSLLGLGCLPKYDAQSCRAWIQAKLLCGLLIERLMREAKFFFPWGYRLPAPEPLARVH